jgi:menaquinone-9 beta-reductase
LEIAYDVAVIGGGPAGTASAITAARAGNKVILFERGRYPRHKVCGEFVSPESHHVLVDLLGKDHRLLQTPSMISRARMFADGHCVEFRLQERAWSITRHDLDFALWQAAEASGVHCKIEAKVEFIAFDHAMVSGGSVSAHTVINASGRWSNLRRPMKQDGPQLIGLKAHFSGEHAPDSTDIYFFEGGYCGVQPISTTAVNASAVVQSNVATSMEEVFAAHPDLWLRSRQWERITDVVTTSPLIHRAPEPVTGGVMNIGDAAGFIDPFVGDGISLALRSGVLAA